MLVRLVVALMALALLSGCSASNESSRPSSQPKDAGMQILAQSQKDAGTGDGSFYNYVTVKNTGSRLVKYVGIKSTCTNDAGTVVAEGYGNEANVAPGEQTVITVIFLSADDCRHINSQFDGLTG